MGFFSPFASYGQSNLLKPHLLFNHRDIKPRLLLLSTSHFHYWAPPTSPSLAHSPWLVCEPQRGDWDFRRGKKIPVEAANPRRRNEEAATFSQFPKRVLSVLRWQSLTQILLFCATSSERLFVRWFILQGWMKGWKWDLHAKTIKNI